MNIPLTRPSTPSGLKTDPSYLQVLLSFYLELDRQADRFFLEHLESDFKLAKDPVTNIVSQQLQRVGHQWSNYHDRGGIDGGIRQSQRADNTFSQRAGELSEVNKLLRTAASHLPVPDRAMTGTTGFLTLVDEEIRLRRERLETLRRFNDEAILTDRLLMLPPPRATNS